MKNTSKNSRIKQFLKLEAAGGIILFTAALLGLLFENSPWKEIFVFAYSNPLFSVKNVHFPTTPQDIINNGLMTVFFLLISLEIKREFLVGELNTRAKAVLPMIAALGGMVLPAVIYLAVNLNHPQYLSGWAIPTATDIAFSLAILTLLGSRIPPTLKTFLLALALIDDLGAIVIIAFFYTNHLELGWLGPAVFCVGILGLLNYFNVGKFFPYAITGIILWFCFVSLGIHATLAGVIVALAIPLTSKKSSLLRDVEKRLHSWVVYGILPLFAFVNAGFSFSAFTLHNVFNTVSIGIVLGLFLGKQFGIFIACWLSTKLGFARLPTQVTWKQIYGLAVICGVGFTMSLYIDTLAFPASETHLHLVINFAVVFASLLSGIVGYLILNSSTIKPQRCTNE